MLSPQKEAVTVTWKQPPIVATVTNPSQPMRYVNAILNSRRADLDYSPQHGSRHVLRGGAYRTLFPFFLIVAVILLLVWRLAFSPTLAAHAPCPSTTIPYIIQPGDTCWDIARRYNSTLDKFRVVNPKIVCSDLHPGDQVCIPDEGSSISRVF